jgi:regulator of sirC expression with transglutaminase-like and TPR domain
VGVLEDEEIDLAGTALLLARIDAPDANATAVEDHLTSIARAAAANHVAADDLYGQADFLARLLAGRLGYRGDSETYEDLANANLIRVVERRRGLPVALGILWLHAAHAAGWDAVGVNLPGHFVVALRAPRVATLVLDAFREGVVVETVPRGALVPMRRREVLLRLQNNIRLRRLHADDVAGAVACARDMLRIAPDSVQLWMDAAALHRRLGDIGAALECYARVTDLGGDGEAGRQARAAIAQLRARLH